MYVVVIMREPFTLSANPEYIIIISMSLVTFRLQSHPGQGHPDAYASSIDCEGTEAVFDSVPPFIVPPMSGVL